MLKVSHIWEAFLDYMEANHAKEIQERTQAREKAIDELKGATTEEQFDQAQSDLVKSKP